MQCWVGIYYIHALFSIITSISFILISLIVQLTYFETKPSSKNPMSKSNSKFDVFMLISKIIILITFNLIGYESNHWILIFILFFISGFMFFLLYENSPFYKKSIKQVKNKYLFSIFHKNFILLF